MNYYTFFSIKGLMSSILINLFFAGILYAQDCKVLKESISGTYDGDCKKGLAQGKGTAKGVDTYTGEFKKGLPHGNGTYTWADGNVYTGEFKNGLMDGAGEMTVSSGNIEGQVTTGYWEEDKYLGKYKEAYNEHSRSAQVTSVRVAEVKKPQEDEKNALFVTITERGANVFDQSIGVDVSVGRHSLIQQASRATRINVVIFPYRAVLTYRGETVDLEIYREGTYNISIDVNLQ